MRSEKSKKAGAKHIASSLSLLTPLPHSSLLRHGLAELSLLGGTGQRRGGRLALLDRLGDGVEVAGADFALVLHRGEAALAGGKLLLLQLDEGAHLAAGVAVGQVEHAVVEAVETGQGDELELVAHRAQFLLEAGDGGVVQVLLPVEAGRAVV